MKDNLEKIKELLLEYKKYVVIGIIGLLVLFLFKNNITPQSNNQNDFEPTIQKKEKSKKDPDLVSTTTGSENKQDSEPENVTCDISGAVKHEGVYTLKNGARLQELITAAGGLAKNAQVKVINRAIQLKDQDKIHIPYKGEKVESASTISQSSKEQESSDKNSKGSTNSEKINLNTASATDLQKLNGIGEKRAQQIVDYREQNGKFKKIEDLMQVSGIGEKLFAALKDQLAI